MEKSTPPTMTAQLLKCLLPDAQLLRLERYDLDPANNRLTLSVCSTQLCAQCPLCSTATRRTHSYYERTLADLGCVNFSLTLLLQVGKFFCDNPQCKRRIFTERLPSVVAPWARKTVRLVERLQAIGLALGGAAGARLAQQMSAIASDTTLLNLLKKLAVPEFEVPKVLGVDDFAFRKGQHYGTILVDLERHRPIALLCDRKAQTLADWLKEHPGVEVLSRDRSKVYKSGMSQGAPEAVQVADRFHLVQNLTETLEQVLNGYPSELKAIAQPQPPTLTTPTPQVAIVQPKPTATVQAQAQFQARHQRRVEQQQHIKQLHEQHWSQAAIAQAVGVSIRTVQHYVKRPNFPATAPHHQSFGQSLLDPYKARFVEWWNAGIRQPTVLISLLKAQGYKGSSRTVTRYISQLRQAQGLPSKRGHRAQSLVKVSDPQSTPFTARRASYLIVQHKENRTDEDQARLEQLVAAHPDLASAVELADEFLRLLRQRQGDGLDAWLMQALTSRLKPFQTFAQGVLDDQAAVQASMNSEVSNGPVEGLNNRLKMLKRQMYGRAGLELLSKRFILAQ